MDERHVSGVNAGRQPGVAKRVLVIDDDPNQARAVA